MSDGLSAAETGRTATKSATTEGDDEAPDAKGHGKILARERMKA